MIFNILVFLLAQQVFCVNSSNEVVIPPAGRPQDCPSNRTCYSLPEHIIRNSFAASDTNFYLLQGTHYIPNGQLLLILFANNLSIEGKNGSMIQGFHETVQQSSVIIQCSGETAGIIIYSGINVTIRGVTIIDCGFNTDSLRNIPNPFIASQISNILSSPGPDDWDFLTLQSSAYVGLLAAETKNLTIHDTSIQNSTEFGMVTININGLVIQSSSFARNSLAISRKFQCNNNLCNGGNVIIAYVNLQQCNSEYLTYKADVIKSNFSFSVGASTLFLPNSGLLVFIGHSNNYFADISLDSIVAYGNIGTLGANIAILTTTNGNGYKVTLRNSLITEANNRIVNSFNTSFGGGFLAAIGFPQNIFENCSHVSAAVTRNIIQIVNTNFTNNRATYGSAIGVLHLNDASKTSFEVISSNINENSGVVGIGVTIMELSTVQLPLDVLISNTTISLSKVSDPLLQKFFSSQANSANLFNVIRVQSNLITGINAIISDDNGTVFFSVITLIDIRNATLHNVVIKNNDVSGIISTHSIIVFKGDHNSLENNRGAIGGGLALLQGSYLILEPPTRVFFTNNSAIRGGGIITEQSFANICFYGVNTADNTSVLRNESQLIFKDNVASEAGSVLYGGDIDNCISHPFSSELFTISNSSRTIFNHVFDYSQQSGSSVISSDAFKVCFCEDSMAICNQRTYSISAIPGSNIRIQLVLVGEQDGFSSGILAIQPNTPGHLLSTAVLQPTTPQCQYISFPLILANNNITMTDISLSVTTEGTSSRRTIEDALLNIYIEECPFGFELHTFGSSIGTCGCHSFIIENFPNITCNVTNRLIMRETSTSGWIGHEFYNNETSCLLLNADCPFGYCVTNTAVNFTLDDDPSGDRQCSNGRSGILCGQCLQNYSLLLGSNDCDLCLEYHNLALILVFIVAGIALVVFLIALNLTVSMSTINGLIFFANIVHINENSILLQTGKDPVLLQFISWLNLDFGFRVCLVPGLDGYVKTWLQFAFPFYIWIIIVIIILSARRSARISVIVSKNAVPVLATLVLISYTKIFRAIIFSLNISDLSNNCNIDWLVWAVDGNINYFSPKHAVLALFSLMILIFLGIPYTLSLLLSPLLESFLSRYKLFKWWVKFKPFIDAYNGPYKDNCRFWTGLLLLARLAIVLNVSFSTNLVINRLVTVTVCILLLSFALGFGGVYTKQYSNILESFFIANLAIVTYSSGFNDDLTRRILVDLCILLSLVVFLGIIVYHVLLRCGESPFVKETYAKIISRKKEKSQPKQTITLQDLRAGSEIDVINRNKSRNTSTEIEIVVRKRESLIFDD